MLEAGGFIAGTLVHTKNGLVPIEQIKVGDLVLSKPESGEGEITYKPVVRTFVHHNREITRIDYKLDTDPNRRYPIYTTWEHPFWVKDQGWTAAAKLHGPWLNEQRLELLDGSHVTVDENRHVYRTSKPDVGWYGNIHDGSGTEWDFCNKKLVGAKMPLDFDIAESEDRYLKTTVYNFEVEGYHTCFVGQHGVWGVAS